MLDILVYLNYCLQTEIESSIPAASPIAALKNSPVVQEMRKLMEQVESLKAEREVIESELKEKKYDMCKFVLNIFK